MGSSLPHCLEEETVSNIKRASLAELDGLPLAISKLARILSNKQDQMNPAELNRAWRKALAGLAKKPIYYMERRDPDLLRLFKDSYENLEEATKPCFMYCALFPKNHIIESKELIEYWMWEGLLGDINKTLEEAMEKGTETLNELKNAHLLQTQSGGEKVKMLNLVRSMAIDTMGKQVCIQSGGFLTSLPRASKHDEWNSEVERASFMENQLKDLKLEETIVFRSLSTLLLQDNPLDSDLDHHFFDSMPNLRVIDLSRTLISTLPYSLSELRNLHALLLRSCPNLTDLPNLSNLQQLLVLDVSGTPIKKCPQGIQKMKKLRRLNLSQTRLESFPTNIVGTILKELEELLMIMDDEGGCMWGSNELEEQWQEACIEDLLKLENVAVLELNFLNTQVFDTYIQKAVQKKKVPSKFRFCVGGFQSGRHVGDNSVTIIGNHRFMPLNTISELHLLRCSEKITVLELEKHSLCNLQVLYVSNLSGIIYLFTLDIFQSLNKLAELHVRKCKQMLEVVKPDAGGNPPTINFPRLNKVALFDLPKLKSVCYGTELICPVLCSLDVSRCENLKRPNGLILKSETMDDFLGTSTSNFRGPTSQIETAPANAVASSSCCADICSRKADKYMMEQLKERKHVLCDLIKDAKQKVEETIYTPDVPFFLRNADDYLAGVNESIVKVEKGIDDKCMSGLLPNLWVQKQARTRMKKMFAELNDLIKEGKDMAQKPVKGYKQPREVAIVGSKRKEIAEEIWKQLVDSTEAEEQAAGTICIHGALGIGKTAIAKYIHNKALVDPGEPFDYVIWVNVEYGAGLQQIQEAIANSLEIDLSQQDPNPRSNADTVEGRAERLRAALIERGKFLLVVDSVWQPLCLDDIGIPELVSGRKLMVTSRIRSIFHKIANKKMYEVQTLPSVDEAWELFEYEMGSSLAHYLEEDVSVSIGIEGVLLAELDGLPLAINELAENFLSDDIHEDSSKLRCDWREELGCSSAKQMPCHLELRDSELFHRFKDSCENLEEVTRNCFLHAVLLPKNHVIQSKELIEYWMWEGLLGDGFETLEEGMEKGRQILNELKNAHLLESVTTEVSEHKVKMLNLFRSMAIETMVNNAGNWVFIESAASLTYLPSEYEWPPEVEKASFTQNQISELRLMKRPKFNRLSTLLLQDNPLDLGYDQYFFYSMPNLRFLDMSRTNISALPKSLSNLKSLEVLVLRNCAKLKSLPDLSNLRDLLVFDLSGTPLKQWPQGIGNMKKLRRLDLSQTELATFPANVVGQLIELEELLVLTDDGCVWGSNEHDQSDGACIEELVGLGKLAVLELHFLDAMAFEIYVKKAEEYTNLPPKFRFYVGKLQNGRYAGQNSVTISGSPSITLPNGTLELQLMMCGKKLKLEGCLRDLNVLDVSNCDDLKYLFSADILGSLKVLRKLLVRSCGEIKKVIKPAEVYNPTKIFHPKLTTMVFFDLPNLECMLWTSARLPSPLFSSSLEV